MSAAVNVARQLIHHELESRIRTAEAALDTLKARAQTTKANVEIKAIGELLKVIPVIYVKLQELKKSSDRWEQTKADLETRIADFEKSLQGIEAKVKVH
jgi:phage shock protein A